jgi:hypothetical protein
VMEHYNFNIIKSCTHWCRKNTKYTRTHISISVCTRRLVQREIDTIISYDTFTVLYTTKVKVDLLKTLPINSNVTI